MRVQVGVNLSEMHRKVAQDMYEAGERALRAKREAAERHDYERREEWYVIARRVRHGLYRAETVEPVLGFGVLSAEGPTAEWATRQLHWKLACELHRTKHDFDPEKGDWASQREQHWKESRERAQKASFYLAETIGEVE